MAFKTQGGEPVNGLTRQHFSGVAYVMAHALEIWDEKRSDDDTRTGDIAMGFILMALLPAFVEFFKKSNSGFNTDRFTDAVLGEQDRVVKLMIEEDTTPEEAKQINEAVDKLATMTCDAVEAVQGRPIKGAPSRETMQEASRRVIAKLKEEAKEE